MVRLVFLMLFLVFFSFNAQAQFESTKRKVNISAMPDKSPEKKAIIPKKDEPQVAPQIKFESQFFKEEEDKLLQNLPKIPKVGEQSNPKTYEVRSSAEIYTEKFNKKNDGEIQERFKSDTFLGEFRSGTKIIKIACRDHEYPDGDLVRVFLNDVPVVNSILLDVDYREVYIELKPGFNKIEFQALNQGESGPNTAQFVVFDDKGNLITANKWNLTTGVKAKIIVVKEDDYKQ